MTRRLEIRLIVGALCLSVAASSARFAQAITHIWQGGTSSMNAGGNWDIGTPVSGSANLTLNFPTGFFSSTLDQDIANPLEVQSLQINNQYYSMSFNAGNPIRLKNLGAPPTINLGTSSQSTTFNIPLEFADPTTITQLGSYPVSFDGALTGSDVTFDTGTSGVAYILGGSSANGLTGATLVKNRSNVYLNKPANTTALGGNVTIDGANAYVYVYNGGGGSNQFAAGTDLTIVNGARFINDGTAQSIDDLAVNSNGSIEVYNTGVLTLGGQLSSAAGIGYIGYGNSNPTIDFDGQFKTVDVTSTGGSEYLQIRDAITNGSINKTGAGKLVISNSSNSFSGTNVVTAGTLAGGPQTIGTVTNNAAVELSTSGTLAANQISGPGQVVIRSTTVQFAAPQNYSGGTILQSGSAYGDATALLGSFTAVGSGALQFSQTTNTTWTGSLSGPASVSVVGTGALGLGGANNYSNGTQVFNGTLEIQSDTAVGAGGLSVYSGTLRAAGARTLANTLTLQGVTFDGSGDFSFTNAAVKQPTGATTHNSTGTTDIAGQWLTGSQTITVNAGQLALGNPNIVNGFTSSGPINVNGGTLTVRSLNFISLPTVTLAGGTLNAPNGYAIPLGAVLQGNGGVTGRVASANGSTIIATGAMTVGDAAHVAGVNLDGELYTSQYAVTLADANQAVVGAVTHLGDGVNNGTLNAPNGLVVNFGRNITGRGQISSTNALAQAVIMNGAVNGDSIANYLEFTGFVKGVGTFNNVAFSGTFSPGLSPALVKVGSALLADSSVLEMEIGGANHGGQYDAIDVAGTLSLGGTLKVSLLDGFAPQAGDEWQLFDGSLAGGFAGFDLPALAAGLSWDVSALATSGIAAVVAGLAGDFNLDGAVNGGDFLAWQRGGGSGGDLVNWRANFGLTAAGRGAAAVPEPASWVILAIGAAYGLCRRESRPRSSHAWSGA
ncbi:MAG: hypothetical protein CMJ58_06235 [Planctomycetaceae bacterium]|nr:hypothetical protein [Planctomycetaceae bacterium]